MSRPWRFVGLSFLVGFISLGQEIVWVRLVSFMLQSVPQSFSFVLFCFIVGIAMGSLVGAGIVRRASDPDRAVARLLAISGALICALPWLLVGGSELMSLPLLGLLILLTAMFKGAIFPLVHHYFSQQGPALGRTLSWVYGANVAGATLGPLLVGFVLMDLVSAHSILFLSGVAELGIALWFWRGMRGWLRMAAAAALVALAWPCWQDSRQLLARYIESLGRGPLTHLIENRHGVIYTVHNDEFGVDRVYGGNVYDGAMNIDIRNASNGIERMYLLSVLHPQPRRVVVIGLSSGSWLKVIESFPDIERIDVIEINPGYVELTRRYPGFSSYLQDPRIQLHFTDGRKWLTQRAAAGERYDLIVMNTTWHWRIYTSNLLSRDFLGVIRGSLDADGMVAFNATGSVDAFYTAHLAFPFAYRYGNFLYAGMQDFRPALSRNLEAFCALDFARLGLPGCEDPTVRDAREQMLQKPMTSWNEFAAQGPLPEPPEQISDDNMLTEYRRGKRLF